MSEQMKDWSEYHIGTGIKLLVLIILGLHLWIGYELILGLLDDNSDNCVTFLVGAPMIAYTILLVVIGSLFLLVSDTFKPSFLKFLKKIWQKYLALVPTFIGFGILLFFIKETNFENNFCSQVEEFGLITQWLIGIFVLFVLTALGEYFLKLRRKEYGNK